MWKNTYKDYLLDGEFIQEPREPGRGIIGCEMHEIQGWQHAYHLPVKKEKSGLFQAIKRIFTSNKVQDESHQKI